MTPGRRRARAALLPALPCLLALAACFAAAPAAGSGDTQPLVTLLASHVARAAPTSASPIVASLAGRRPLTGVRTVVPVLERAPGWVRVGLPGRPNGRTGWISTRSTLPSTTVWRLVVRLAARQLVVLQAGRVVRRFGAVVGKPSTPTPTGRFFVEEPVRLSGGEAGGPFALALSARSQVLQEFDGGPGQIAVHGRDGVGGVLGTAVSHGCVRLDDAAMVWLVGRIRAGTPVTIRR